MSAISALAARRREAAVSAQTTPQPSECDENQGSSNTNYFSPLRKDDSQSGKPSTPKKSVAKVPRQQRGAESPASHPRGVALARYIARHLQHRHC
jgi:hypothetical protein